MRVIKHFRNRAIFTALSCSLLWLNSSGILLAAPKAESPQARPKIGLALGGGGALGISHIGVIRALEELRIPIDYIAGTSMGAIVGGLYASGMSPDDMERELIQLNWWDVLKDKTARRDMQFHRKRDDSRYLMDFEIGIKGLKILLPNGLSSGQKFNNILQSLTVNSAGISDFNKLNVPFHATATDIQSGALVVLTNGNLGTAMRASMAVPGVFTPVWMDGKQLVDGGIVDNLPVDVVRAMGAEIIIAVDVGKRSSEAGARRAVQESLSQVVARTYSIMRRPTQDIMGQSADVLITPDVSAFTASDFAEAANIIPTGIASVAEVESQLRALSVDEKTFQKYIAQQRKKNPRPTKLTRIMVDGNQRVATPSIQAQILSKTNEPIRLKAIERDAARVYGLGDFQNVTYELEPEDDGYHLALHVKEKYWGPSYLRFGLRLETDGDHGATWGALVNYSRRQMNALGGEFQFDAGIGSDQHFNAEWFQPLNAGTTLFVAPAIRTESMVLKTYTNRTPLTEYERNNQVVTLDVGSQFYSWGQIRAGLSVDSMDIKKTAGPDDWKTGDDLVVAATTRFRFDRLDDAIFPTRGFDFQIGGFFADEALGSDVEYSKVFADGSYVKSLGRNTFIVGGSIGHSLGTDVPQYDQFTLGGFDSLPGLSPGQLRGPYFALSSIRYHYKIGTLSPSLGDGIYFMLRCAMGNVWQEKADIGWDDWVGSVGTGIGADTTFGPVMLAIGYAEHESLTYFFSVGTLF